MSRSKHNSKGAGYEYSKRRAGNKYYLQSPSTKLRRDHPKNPKTFTNRIERRKAKQELHDAIVSGEVEAELVKEGPKIQIVALCEENRARVPGEHVRGEVLVDRSACQCFKCRRQYASFPIATYAVLSKQEWSALGIDEEAAAVCPLCANRMYGPALNINPALAVTILKGLWLIRIQPIDTNTFTVIDEVTDLNKEQWALLMKGTSSNRLQS